MKALKNKDSNGAVIRPYGRKRMVMNQHLIPGRFKRKVRLAWEWR